MSHLALGQSGTTMAKYTQTCILVPEKKRDLSQEPKLQHSQNRNNAINFSLPQFLLSGWKRKTKTGLCPPGMVIRRLRAASKRRLNLQQKPWSTALEDALVQVNTEPMLQAGGTLQPTTTFHSKRCPLDERW